jgi:hypothetical protein
MKKLPVLATIRDAYNFTFTHLGAIIGLIWLPMILVTVIGFFVFQRYLDAYAGALASGDYASMGSVSLGVLCFSIAALLLFTMMSVPVTQLALGTRKQGALVHFAFSGIEWRLFRGILGLVGLLLVPLLIISVVVGLLATGNAGMAGAVQAGQVGLIMFIPYFACLVYFGLRFGLVLPALATSENGPLLPRAWKLTAGNFWRLLVVAAAILIPIEAVSVLLHLAVEGPRAFEAQNDFSTAMAAAQMHAMAMEMPLNSGISFLIAPMLLGLVLGAGASVYRMLNTTHTIDESA